jgi:hypothetical protein
VLAFKNQNAYGGDFVMGQGYNAYALNPRLGEGRSFFTASTEGSHDPNCKGRIITLFWQVLDPNGTQVLNHTSHDSEGFDFWTWTVFFGPAFQNWANFSSPYTLKVTGTNNYGVSTAINSPVEIGGYMHGQRFPEAYGGGPYNLTCTSTVTLDASRTLPQMPSAPDFYKESLYYIWTVTSRKGEVKFHQSTLDPTVEVSMHSLHILPGTGPYQVLLECEEDYSIPMLGFPPWHSQINFLSYKTTLYVPSHCTSTSP